MSNTVTKPIIFYHISALDLPVGGFLRPRNIYADDDDVEKRVFVTTNPKLWQWRGGFMYTVHLDVFYYGDPGSDGVPGTKTTKLINNITDYWGLSPVLILDKQSLNTTKLCGYNEKKLGCKSENCPLLFLEQERNSCIHHIKNNCHKICNYK